jgi:hypothetical protein
MPHHACAAQKLQQQLAMSDNDKGNWTESEIVSVVEELTKENPKLDPAIIGRAIDHAKGEVEPAQGLVKLLAVSRQHLVDSADTMPAA